MLWLPRERKRDFSQVITTTATTAAIIIIIIVLVVVIIIIMENFYMQLKKYNSKPG